MIFSFISLLTIFFITVITFAVLLAGYFIAKPLIFIEYYKKQKAQGYFKPFLGFFHDRIQDAHKNGDFFKFCKDIVSENPTTNAIVCNYGSRPVLCLVESDLVKEFLNQPHLYRKAAIESGVDMFFQNRGILFLEGEQWKKQRKHLAVSFQNELLKDQIPLIETIAGRHYQRILMKNQESVNIQRINQEIAGDIMGEFFFGRSYKDSQFEGKSITAGFIDLIHEGYRGTYKLENLILETPLRYSTQQFLSQRFMSRIRNLRETLKTITNLSRKTLGEEETLLKNLTIQQSQFADGMMTDHEIIDNFISLFIASVDPTGNLVSMALYFLSQNQEAYRRTIEEVEEIVASEKVLDFAQIQKMKYISAVLKETLRMANPQGMIVFREALEDHRLKDLEIRKGTLVTFSPILNGFNSRYFLDFNRFDPERWLSKKDQNSELNSHPFVFLPFSAGPKACLGQHLAFLQTKIMMFTLLRSFEMKGSNDYSLKMMNRGVYGPLEDLRLNFISRQPLNPVL